MSQSKCIKCFEKPAVRGYYCKDCGWKIIDRIMTKYGLYDDPKLEDNLDDYDD